MNIKSRSFLKLSLCHGLVLRAVSLLLCLLTPQQLIAEQQQVNDPSAYSPTPEITFRKAPEGSSIIYVLDLSGISPTAKLDLLGIKHALDAFGIPYLVTSSISHAVSAPEMLIVAGAINLDFKASLRSALSYQLAQWMKQSGHTLFLAGTTDISLLNALGAQKSGIPSQLHSMLKTVSVNPPHPLLNYVDSPEEYEVWLAKQTSTKYIYTYAYQGSSSSDYTSSVLATFEDGQPGLLEITHNPSGGRMVLIGAKWRDLLLRMEIESNKHHTRGSTNVFEPSTDTVRLWLRAAYEKWTKQPSLREPAPHHKRAAIIITHDIDARTAYIPLRDVFLPYENEHGFYSSLMVTTSYRSNGWMSRYYNVLGHNEILANALQQGFPIQSHSVSHLPDMSRWSPGAGWIPPETYAPVYSSITKSSSGGTVLPELLISKYLLQRDFPISVTGWRSGHLEKPRQLGKLLQQTGYWWESDHTAGRVGGSLPFLMLEDYLWSAQTNETRVLSFPLAISDNNITTRTAIETAMLWSNVTYKNAANNVPTVLLVHPTRPEVKMPPYQLFIEQVINDPNLWVGSMDDYYAWYRSQGIRSQQN